MLRRIHGLYILLASVAGYFAYDYVRLFRSPQAALPAAATFLQGHYWGSDGMHDKHAALCLKGQALDCGELGFLEEKAGKLAAARTAYEQGCKLGDDYSCQRSADQTTSGPSADPLAEVATKHWPNGLEVIALPQPHTKEFQIAVEVQAGWQDEPSGKTGVAHLTEHAMFRDPRLPDGASYLDAIRARDGTSNGFTMQDTTLYFAKVDPSSAVWLARTFVQMMTRAKLAPKDLEKSKSEIYLERKGKTAGFSFRLPWVLIPTFSETEFGVRSQPNMLGDELFSTKMLRPADVATFYATHYRPAAMTVYLTGNYNVLSVNKVIDEGFGAMPARGGAPTATPLKPLHRPYVGIEANKGTAPQITLGSKFWGASAKDVVGMDIYMQYVAHRLMKEIRGSQGGTYTAYGGAQYKPWGVAVVRFEAREDSLFPYIDLLRRTIDGETQGKRLRDEQLTEAMWLFKGEFRRHPLDQEHLFEALRQYGQFRRMFHTDQTPFQIAETLTPTSLRQILKKHFQSPRFYLEFSNPIFNWKSLSFALMLLLAPTLLLRLKASPLPQDSRILHLDRSKWPTIGWLWLLLLYGFLLLLELSLEGVAEHAVPGWELAPRTYALAFNAVGVVVTMLSGWALAWMRGLSLSNMVLTDQALWLQSRYGNVRCLPLVEIQTITVRRFWRLDRWWFRAYWPDLEIWRKGVAVSLKDGQTLFFAPRAADTFAIHLRNAQAASTRPKHVPSAAEVLWTSQVA